MKRSALSKTTQDSPFVHPPATPPSSTSSENTNRQAIDVQARDSLWTRNSATFGLKGENIGPSLDSKNEVRAQTRIRSSSESTIDANSARQSMEQGAFKVVIERAEGSAKDPQDIKLSLPTLEVPIPHYRLGTPRFSERGTAFLHNSVYTRTSTNEDLKNPTMTTNDLEGLFPMPPGQEQPSILNQGHSQSTSKQQSTHLKPRPSQYGPPKLANPPVSHSTQPIVPSIYDALAATPNNPAVVRFSPLTGEIAAATPARIIAQVTSENFLDYELLSDFFLTVRAYLSTHDLLAYLVARFEWAINRFDDNGRVIRVRAFAALRHWILNYFSYDFLYDRPLRVDFCRRLNELTKLVRGRIHYGNSDMKLISDLKKCWNGRCILYWDYPDEAASVNPQETDIHPGGIPGSRDSRLHHPSQLLSLGAHAEPVAPLQLSTSRDSGHAQREVEGATQEAGSRFANGHVRQESSTTIRSLPISPISEQSIQALSCSIPAKSLKRMLPHNSKPVGGQTGAQQVGDNRRVCPAAPSSTANDHATEPLTGHKRSGSFSDAARDRRASLSSERYAPSQEQDQLSVPYLGSLIRGNLVQPPQPYVNIHSPTTPSIEVPSITFANEDNSVGPSDGRRPGDVPGPGVKTLIGTIRRALSRKYSTSSGSVNLGTGLVSVPSLPNDQNPTPPPKLVFTEVYRNTGKGTKSTLRIDLLAADIAEAFHRAMMEHVEQGHDPQQGFQLALELEPDRSIVDDNQQSADQQLSPPEHEAPDYLRIKSNIGSGITSGSQSIVIVNDTGFGNPPVPALPEFLHQKDNLHFSGPESFTMTRSFTPPLSADPSMRSFPPEQIARQNLSIDHPLQGTSSRLVVPLANGGQPSFSSASGSASATTIVLDSKSEWTRSRVIRGQSFRTNRTGSSSLRKYASYQSTFTKSGAAGSTFDTSIPPGSMTDTHNYSLDSATTGSPPKAVTRTLRRKPGGDLKANHHVHDMEGLHRTRSMGSITTYSSSQRESYLNAGRGMPHKSGSYRSSGGARSTSVGRQKPGSQKTPSFVHTHSSQPAIRRPSFEAAVAEFARIPDDDEGGIEATLLKLEGKYTKSPVEANTPQPLFPSNDDDEQKTKERDQAQATELRRSVSEHDLRSDLKLDSKNHELEDRRRDPRQSFLDDQSPGEEYPVESRGLRNSIVSSHQYAESEESYNSIPLLDRSSSARIPRKRQENTTNSETVPHPLFDMAQIPRLEQLREDGTFRRRGRGSSIPTTTTDSFLLDDDESLSDLSSDMSGDLQDHIHHRGYDTTPRTSTRIQEAPALNIDTHPPSPPMSTENTTSPASHPNPSLQPRRPPTPDPSPISQPALPTVQGTLQSTIASQTSLQNSLHLPFVVGYESSTLAEQFTIIEKDALNEIDWRDLVDMRWHDSSPKVTNWVEYLRTHESRGIDLVTARFNIMAKWALSEIMLTRNVEERALTIMKYIHIAHQARKIRNYATLLQITIALTSVDCTRLSRTWEKVPAGEKRILAELEALVTPRKNFQALRMEMEKANAEQGCIPVVGMCYAISILTV